MRFLCLLVSLSFLTACSNTTPPNKPTGDLVVLLSEFTALLKLVKGQAGAETHLPKLKALDQSIQEHFNAKLPLTPEQQNKIPELTESCDKEILRLEALPAARAVLIKDLVILQKVAKANRLRAEDQVEKIKETLEHYHYRHDKYPETLKALFEGESPANDSIPEALIDPWNKPLQYNPKGPKNNGEKPDVWAVSPDGSLIGNWKKAPK